MFVVGTRFEESHGTSVPSGSAIDTGGPAVPGWLTLLFVGLGLAIVAVAPLSAARIHAAGETGHSIAKLPSVTVSGPWLPSARDLAGWAPRVAQADAVFNQTYTDGRSLVTVYLAFYSSANREAEVGSRGEILTGRNWIATPPVRRLLDSSARLVQVNETVLHSQLSTIRVWTWYSVDHVDTPRDYVAKLLLAKSRILGRAHGAATIAIATDEKPGTDAVPILRGFLKHLVITAHDPRP